MRGRIERLEEAILPSPPEPPEFMEVQFVDAQKNVVDTMVFQLGQVRPSEHRTAQEWPRVKGEWWTNKKRRQAATRRRVIGETRADQALTE